MDRITATVTFEVAPAPPGTMCSDKDEPATHTVIRVHTSKTGKTRRYFEWADSEEACRQRAKNLTARRVKRVKCATEAA